MAHIEYHLKSPHLLQTSQPRTELLGDTRNNAGRLATEVRASVERGRIGSHGLETPSVDETVSYSTISSQEDNLYQKSFQRTVEEVTSPTEGQVGPLALLPYFRAYLAQEKVCQYTDKVLESRGRGQESNSVYEKTGFSRAESTRNSSSSRQRNPSQMFPSSEIKSNSTPTGVPSRRPVPPPQRILTQRDESDTDRDAVFLLLPNGREAKVPFQKCRTYQVSCSTTGMPA